MKEIGGEDEILFETPNPFKPDHQPLIELSILSYRRAAKWQNTVKMPGRCTFEGWLQKWSEMKHKPQGSIYLAVSQQEAITHAELSFLSERKCSFHKYLEFANWKNMWGFKHYLLWILHIYPLAQRHEDVLLCARLKNMCASHCLHSQWKSEEMDDFFSFNLRGCKHTVVLEELKLYW